MVRRGFLALFIAGVFAGCTSAHFIDAGGFDSGREDAGPGDGSRSDAGPLDATVTPLDAGPPDAGPGDAGPPVVCGDGVIGVGESCDDGDDEPGDGCDASCGIETDWGCWGEPSFCGWLTGTCPSGFVFIPAGPFRMGCAGIGCFPDGREQPIHDVILSAYCIMETEVTVDEYASCTACSAAGTGTGCNAPLADRGDHPITCVDWNQARAYCDWRTAGQGDLPTEAQWEKAARGTTSRIYPWGDTVDCARANFDDCPSSPGETWPVGSRPSGDSPYGLSDMAGNVWEWVLDWFQITYYTSCDCGSCEVDPLNDCISAPGHRSNRGGSFGNLAASARSSNRSGSQPLLRSPNVGLRCAATPTR